MEPLKSYLQTDFQQLRSEIVRDELSNGLILVRVIRVMQNQNEWTAIDDYIGDLLIPQDQILDQVLQASAEAGLPAHQVSPLQGKLLFLLARIQKARSILEIGTLGGYSTVWLARALPVDGTLITLEAEPKHALVAQRNVDLAGFNKSVQIRIGKALETLPELQQDPRAPFDLVFIDADKASTADYFDWAIKLTRAGSLIIADNVIRNGEVIDPQSDDPSVQGVRRFYEKISGNSAVSATAIQTVGCKGYDGFALLLRN